MNESEDIQQSKLIKGIMFSRSAFHNAPELLMEQMMELQKILVNFKTKNGENDTYKKFTEILNTMRFSFNYMSDIASIYKENYYLKLQNTTLTELLYINDNEISKYKTIEAAILDGTLEDKINVIKRKTEQNG